MAVKGATAPRQEPGAGVGGGLKLREALQLVAAGETSSGPFHKMTSLQSKACNLDEN